MPYAYRDAQAEWRSALDTVRDHMGLESDNMAYTALQGVLLAFRRRLSVDQVLRFADLLPAVPRAVLVAHRKVCAQDYSRAERSANTHGLLLLRIAL